LVLLVLSGLGIRIPGTIGTMLNLTGGVPGAVGLIMLGLLQTLSGQIGRALFDMANATRDLAVIARAQLAHAAGDVIQDDDEPA
jgi:hypothetical protein